MDDLNNAVRPPLQLLPPLWRWQGEATATTLAALAKQDHHYIQAPMGTGKTRVIFEISESPTIVGTRLLIVGLGSVISQHRQAFLGFGCRPTSHAEDEEDFETPAGQRVAILTWQRLYKLARRSENPFGDVGMIVFDECHIGASGEDLHDYGVLKESFDFFKPVKRVYVSATPGTVNEQLLGSKEGHIYKLPLRQAYDDGLLNPLEMIEVHAGDRARIADVEAATRQKMEDLQMLEAKNTAGLARELLAKGVGLGDAKQTAEALFRIVQQRHDVMIELYMERHPNVQAIFYSPTIVHANDATDRFNQLARKRRLDGLRAQSVNSKADNYAKHIERFREGQIRVLFVVGMLQEAQTDALRPPRRPRPYDREDRPIRDPVPIEERFALGPHAGRSSEGRPAPCVEDERERGSP
jgi:superfamily II DNA or RNA helicase